MQTFPIKRLLGITTLFLITTGQASTDGCAEAPAKDASEVAAADTPGKAPHPATNAETADPRAAPGTDPGQASGNAGLPVGEYQCLDTYTEVGADMRISYKEVLLIEDENTYRYRKNGPTGKYAFTPATGEIRWISGPYGGGNPQGRFERKPNGRDLITLTYTFDKLGSDDDFCFRKAAAH